MFVTVYSYHAKPGALDRIRALYQEWRDLLRPWPSASTEMLSNPQDPAELMMLARFPDEDAAWAATETAGHSAWYARLVCLAEAGPMIGHYRVVP